MVTGPQKRKQVHGNTTTIAIEPKKKEKPPPKAPPCVICEKYDKSGDRFFTCKDCPARIHLVCLRETHSYSKSEELNWYCNGCQTCVVCYETSIMVK